MKEKISIIIPKYKPKKEIFNKLKKYLKKNARGIEVLEIEGLNGLANAYNEGIKKSQGEIIITIHQDCIPLEKDSIEKLIASFENKNVVAAYSWIMEEDKKEKYYPFAPDGKFTAFRKSALKKVKLFNEKIYFTGGEDVDLWLKLKKIGKVVKANTGLLHIHPNYKGNRTIEKRKQNGSINGALCRKWGIKNPKWFKAIISSIIYPTSYGKEFVISFFIGKQTYRRKE
jgi:GT2 family glycosyltransferase